MGTKNNPSKFDCYATAHPDEPYFVILGRDRTGADFVRLWAARREQLGDDTEQIIEARTVADAMEAWCTGLGKLPIRTALFPSTPEELWDAFINELRIWYRTEPKNFLGDSGKHQECFIRALQKLIHHKEKP